MFWNVWQYRVVCRNCGGNRVPYFTLFCKYGENRATIFHNPNFDTYPYTSLHWPYFLMHDTICRITKLSTSVLHTHTQKQGGERLPDRCCHHIWMSHVWRVSRRSASCLTWISHVSLAIYLDDFQRLMTYKWVMSDRWVMTCSNETWFERGVAGIDPSTRGQSPVVLKVQFRSRALLKGEIKSEIVLGYLHYLVVYTV